MQDLQKFWGLVVEVWDQGFLGFDIARIGIAILVFALFLLLRGLLTRFVLDWLKMLAKRTRSHLDDEIIAALREPIRLIPVALGAFFAFEHLALEDTFKNIGDNIVRSLIAFVIFWGFWRVVQPASRGLRQLERVFTQELVDWLVKAVKVAVVLVGAATILQIWGIQVGPIIAGAGLFGVAVALGAQDLFKNLISGILILGEKRFRKGDYILVEDTVEGVVESIGFRSTVVRRLDQAPVLVPNAKLSDTAVTNFSGRTHRRISWLIGVEYRTTIEQLRQIRNAIEKYIVDSDNFANPSEISTYVHIDSFNDSSIDIMIYCFTKTTVWGEFLKVKEDLAYRIKEIIESAGAEFAFPSQSVYVESTLANQPEIFVLPKENKTAG
ncbi:MAG: Low conductance mechanosensitive channel YnaI [Alphaproteobacteria bacterium MarineAlpha3_Bin4]|nr:MAG: Low conductance mechanosensitive channel YnaI [Alphaproteobacteria bacterium MarineAlpha3_Bin4]